MAHLLLKALICAATAVAPSFHPRPIHTEAEAITAFYEQWQAKAHSPGTLKKWQNDLRGHREGSDWLLLQGGSDRLEIYIDAATGRLRRFIIVDQLEPLTLNVHFWRKADVGPPSPEWLLLTQSGHSLTPFSLRLVA